MASFTASTDLERATVVVNTAAIQLATEAQLATPTATVESEVGIAEFVSSTSLMLTLFYLSYGN
jgi:hypothetical protein